MTNNVEATLDDVLEAIATSSQAVENRLEKIESEIKDIRATAVTETVLDKKFEKYGDRITELAKDGNTKLSVVVETLHEKKIFTTEEKKKILSLKPFAQLAM